MPRRPHVALFLQLSLCLIFATSFGPSAAAKGPGQKQRDAWKQQIEALEQQWRTAILTTDVSLMDKLLSDDYVGISMSGEISTKAMQLDRLRSSHLTISRLDLSDVKVKRLGRVAIVTSLADVEGTNEGNLIHGRFRYTRVYQRTGPGIWKITNFEATHLSDHSGPGHRRPAESTDGQDTSSLKR